jgi:hypothetical protein
VSQAARTWDSGGPHKPRPLTLGLRQSRATPLLIGHRAVVKRRLAGQARIQAVGGAVAAAARAARQTVAIDWIILRQERRVVIICGSRKDTGPSMVQPF